MPSPTLTQHLLALRVGLFDWLYDLNMAMSKARLDVYEDVSCSIYGLSKKYSGWLLVQRHNM